MGKKRSVLLAIVILGTALLLVAGIQYMTGTKRIAVSGPATECQSAPSPVVDAATRAGGHSPTPASVPSKATAPTRPTPTPSSSPTPRPTLTPTPSPPPVFGVEMRRVNREQGLPLAQAAGVYWLRRNGLRWADVEPVPGARHWKAVAALETELQAAYAAGLQTILVVRRTPDWAQKVPGHYCGPVAPEAMDELARFMAEAVDRYKNPPFGVKYWEIWNEPDIDPRLVGADSPFGCWGDQDDEYYGGKYYARMLQSVYPAIKAADPEAQVLIGGLLLDKDPAKDELPNPPAQFLAGILRGGGGDFFDIVSFHGYVSYRGQLGDWGRQAPAWSYRGGNPAGKVDFLREVLATYSYEKPLMLTEAGLLCWGCPSPPPAAYLEAQAAYVPRLYVRSIAWGLLGTFWYTLDSPGWREAALLDRDQRPRPAYRAFSTMTALLKDAHYLRPVDDLAGLEGYVFERADEEGEIWVLWSPDGTEITLPLPSGLQRAYDLFGVLLEPEGGMVEIGFDAVYLEISPARP